MVKAVILPAVLLAGCAHAPEPEPAKASKWMGACQVCEVRT